MDPSIPRDPYIPEPPPLASEGGANKIGLCGAGAALVAGLSGLADVGGAAADAVAATRVLFSVAGMILAGAAVTLNYRATSLWLIAALTCALAVGGIPQSWDTYRLAAGVLAGVMLVGAVLLSMPTQWRMRVGGCLAVLHFMFIFIAVTCPPPASALTNTLWAIAARPYLTFAYLNNAYQFYSPDPGPASEIWFCIYYEPKADDKVKIDVLQYGADGKALRDKHGNLVYKPMTDAKGELTGEPIYDAAGNYVYPEVKDAAGNLVKKPVYVGDEQKADYLPIVRWVKVPKHDRDYKDPLGQAYYRRLSLSEQIAHFTPLVRYPQLVQDTLLRRRAARANDIPLDTSESPLSQCLIPDHNITEFIVPSYVRYVAQQNETPERPIAKIKVYRTMHATIVPDSLMGTMFKGKRLPVPLNSPISYYPYYLGEFSAKGELLVPNDPLLYWLIPIRRNPSATVDDFEKAPAQLKLEDYKRLYEDFVYKHAESHHMEGELEK